MKITAIKAWQVDLPLKEGRYSWSNGNFVEVFDSTVVAPEDFCFSATDFNSYGTVSIARGAPQRVNGRMTAPDSPGLGIEPDFDVLVVS
jgi:hypothetical protein